MSYYPQNSNVAVHAMSSKCDDASKQILQWQKKTKTKNNSI